jgi:hypothetical protein
MKKKERGTKKTAHATWVDEKKERGTKKQLMRNQ